MSSRGCRHPSWHRRGGFALPEHSRQAMTHRAMMSEALAAEAERLRLWLLNEAFPLWWEVGADHSGGGWYERIDFDGSPVVLPKRSRVAARQVFCYCEAGRLGWQGPWRQAATHALSSLRDHFNRSDGTVIAALSQAGPRGRRKFRSLQSSFRPSGLRLCS